MKITKNLSNFNFNQFLLLSIILGFLNSCEKAKKDPQIDAISIQKSSFVNLKAVGLIKERGDYRITDYGFVYNVDQTANLSYVAQSNKISLGPSLPRDTFVAVVSLGNNQYYSTNYKIWVWAYVTNSKGTLYSKPVSHDVLNLQLSKIVPAAAKPLDTVTIYGSNFNSVLSQNVVLFNNTSATVISVTDNTISVIVPNGINNSYSTYITVSVSTNGQSATLSSSFQLLGTPTGFSPNTGTWGTNIYITGTNLSSCSLYFGTILSSYYNNGSTYISASIPSTILTKKFKIYTNCAGIMTEVPGGYFTMNSIALDPMGRLKYFPGSVITFTGSGFNSNYALNTLNLGSYRINSTSAYSQLQFTLPPKMPAGNYPFFICNGIDTVYGLQNINVVIPKITSLSIDSAYSNTNLTINGENLLVYPSQYTNLYLGSQYMNISSMDETKINVTVPSIEPGKYNLRLTIDYNEIQSNLYFTIRRPKLTDISPSSGNTGISLIITGEGFDTNNAISFYFGNLLSYGYPSSSTKVNVIVPTALTKGTWQVNAYQSGHIFSSGLSYTVN